MTAEVVIFNKSAVALAADSAVSIEGHNSSKIYNNAEKLFALSKYHPVAVMIYERNELQGVPWELIIKAFRKKQGDKYYNTLVEYKDAFLAFSREFYFALPPKKIESWCTQSIHEVVLSTLDIVFDRAKEAYSEDMREIDIYDVAINELLDCYQGVPFFLGLDENSLERAELEFDKFAYKALTEQIETADFNEKEDKDWLNTCNSFYVLCKARLLKQDPFYVGLTGLVFAGYGEQEYFPEVCECEVYGAIDDQIKVVEKEGLSRNDVTAGVKAFAQRDEVNTFMEGVSVGTKDKFIQVLSEISDFDESEIRKLIEIYVPEEEREKVI